MADTIFLRVGTEDRISLDIFIESLRNFLSVLHDLDAAVSHDPRGSVEWEVVSLYKNTPAVVGVAPKLRSRKARDMSSVVEEQLIMNTKLLAARAERNDYMSDAALSKIERLAKLTPKIGAMEISVGAQRETIKAAADITEKTLTNVQQLTGVKYTAYGSIVGSLDAISVHHGNEFRVWDESTKKSVRCKFNDPDLERVKSLLKSRVIVYGELQSNSAGNPIAIDAAEFQQAPVQEQPTIAEMSGLVENFTGGLSLKEYMEMLSNE